jgi:hypothetical protein
MKSANNDLGNGGVKKFYIISVKKFPLSEWRQKISKLFQIILPARVLEILGNNLKF